jgi:hypothetical protein
MIAGIAPAARAMDFSGVLPAASDQPQINALLIDPNGQVVSVTEDDGFGDIENVYCIQAYLDTGTSGILLSQETQEGLNVGLDSYQGEPIQFYDVDIGGLNANSVTTPYTVAVAPFDTDNAQDLLNPPPPTNDFTPVTGPVRMEATQTPADDLIGPIDIMGMAVLQNQVAVMDLRPPNSTDPDQFGYTSSYIYHPGTPFASQTLDTAPGIPPMQYHIKVSYANFSQFTLNTPDGAPSPVFESNPMVGPNPLNPTDDTTPPVSVSYNGHTATGSFLLDTGSASSFISSAIAAKLGVEYGPGVDANDNPYLINATTGKAIPDFVEEIEGAGGSIVDAAGFYLDSLSLSTVEGEPLTYLSAPVLVEDLTLDDGDTSLTLDGDLGMNFFEPTIDPDTFAESAGPYDWMTFDQANGLIGLQLAGDPIQVPEPITLAPILLGGAMLLRRRARRN